MTPPPEQAPDGSIVITAKEFYDGVQADIREIKEALSPVVELRAEVLDHENRLGRLERLTWVALGVAIASGAPTVASLLAK